MSSLDLARWQFGVTTVYHFLFVPITIGITWFVATFETLWYRRGDEHYLRLTRFFGKLMLINFAIGVVTGIVQEFQFGMNWSAYSRYVGDIFGAPLAMEALAAFFLESTFLGLWIFGWGRLSARLHLAIIYAVAFGSTLSAFFILAANSWMQHPVGYVINHATGRAEMTSIGKVLTNPTLLYAFPHTIGAAVMTGGMLVVGVSAWHLARGSNVEMFSRSHPHRASGRLRRRALHDDDRPRAGAADDRAAADEDGGGRGALRDAEGRAVLALRGRAVRAQARAARRSTSAPARPLGAVHQHAGTGRSRASTTSTRLPGEVRPRQLRADRGRHLLDVPDHDGHRLPDDRHHGPRHVPALARAPGDLAALPAVATAAIALPLLANASGWIFTEMGRQPWVVQGLLKTSNAVSPSVSAWEVGLTLAGFTLLYGAAGRRRRVAHVPLRAQRAARTRRPARPGVVRARPRPLHGVLRRRRCPPATGTWKSSGSR